MSWSLVSLADAATIARTGVAPENIIAGTTYVGLENIDGLGDFVGVGSVDAGELASTKFRFTKNQVLFGKLRPYLKKTARPCFDGVCSTDILPLSPAKHVDRDYLFHALRRQSFVDEVTSLCAGANLPRISPSVLGAMRIPLPPLAEQRRIAAILDKADALRAKRREAIAKLDQLLQSVFLDMFGDTVTNPKSWSDDQCLGDVADICSGITKGRHTVEKVRGVPYLAVANVQDRHLRLNGVKAIEATEAEIHRYRLKVDDLLLTEGGDPDKLGRGALWDGSIPDCIHQNHVFRVRVTSREISPVYLNWLVGSPRGKRYFLGVAKQTTGIASINMTQLKRFPLLTPPIKLQRRFADAVSRIDEYRKHLDQASLASERLMQSLQRNAFAGTL